MRAAARAYVEGGSAHLAVPVQYLPECVEDKPLCPIAYNTSICTALPVCALYRALVLPCTPLYPCILLPSSLLFFPSPPFLCTRDAEGDIEVSSSKRHRRAASGSDATPAASAPAAALDLRSLLHSSRSARSEAAAELAATEGGVPPEDPAAAAAATPRGSKSRGSRSSRR